MDPLGFAFENYDGIGKFRTMDNGGTVDATGSFELDGQRRSFNDARELVQVLAGQPDGARCFATQWARFALQAQRDRGGPGLAATAIAAAFGSSGSNVRDLLVGVAGSRSFRYRAPAQGEMLQ